MRRIIETLLEEGIDESMVHRVLDLIEEEYEVISELKAPDAKSAQAVVDRKVQQLKQNSDDMNKAEQNHRTLRSLSDGWPGMENRSTINASRDHKRTILKGAALNNGAFRIAKAGKKHGADIGNLKYSMIGHNNEVRRQIDSRNSMTDK